MNDNNESQYEEPIEKGRMSKEEKIVTSAHTTKDTTTHTTEDTATVATQTAPTSDKSVNDYTDEEYLELYQNSRLGKSCSSQGWIHNIRTICCKLPGYYYCILHMIFMLLVGVIIFFVTNKSYLCMTLLVISLDAFANVVFFDCPLSSLEKKYLNTSLIDSRLKTIQNYGMMYANNKVYDTQLEVIINGWTLCAGKILFLIVFDWFHIAY